MGGGPGGRGPGGSRTGHRGANPRRRARLLFLALLFVFTVFAAQLVRLQAIDAERIAAEAQELRSWPTTVPAERGEIEDGSGVPLAQSSKRYDVVVDQVTVAEYQSDDPQAKAAGKTGAAAAAAKLAPVLGRNESELTAAMTGEALWAPIARSVEPSTWLAVDNLGIPGVTSELVPTRYYPGGAASASVVGWVGADGTAQADQGGGLEYLYNQALTGKPGRIVREYSLDNRVIPMGHSEVDPAVPGETIRTTLDADLNWYAHTVLAERVKELDAEAGVVVIMDREGRLLSVTQTPTFDPANRGVEGSDFSAMAFQGAVEPGSIAKIATMGGALDLGATHPTDKWVIPNRYTVDGQEFRDSSDHETLYLTTAGILAKSSNIGTVMLSELYPREKLYEYMRAFGLGTRTAIGFPGESPGVLKEPQEWDGRSRYTIAFGQAMTATPVQVTGIMQTIANKGMHVAPTLIAGRTDESGEYHPSPLPRGNQAVSEQTADEIARMLESVVSEEGTAIQAAVPGFNIAGKTGTSNRYTGDGGYVSSFVGYAPADAPQFIMGVFIIDPEKGIYGGANAGPVFSSVMSYALQKYGVAPSGAQIEEFPLTYPPPAVKPGAYPTQAGEAEAGANPAATPTSGTSAGEPPAGRLPDELDTEPAHAPTRKATTTTSGTPAAGASSGE